MLPSRLLADGAADNATWALGQEEERLTGSQKSACVEELETRRGRGGVVNNGTMEKSEEETLEVSFSSRKRKGMYVSERSEKQYEKEAQNSAHLASPMCFKHTLGIQASPQLADATDI